ncbi:MAG: hypothetical protein V4813_04290 [Gemmatimonadota bacterium]
MPNTLYVSRGTLSGFGGLLVAAALAGCSDKTPVTPEPEPTTATRVTLATFGVQTVPGSAGVTFVNSGRYAVMPQFAATNDFATGTSRATVPDYPFVIGGVAALSARIDRAPRQSAELTPAEAFHLRLRNAEAAEAPQAAANLQSLRSRGPVNLSVQSAQVLENRDFRVLSSLTTSTYTTVTARLLYTGTNVLLYVDTTAPTNGGFSDTEYQNFGKQFDSDLFPIDVSAFGNTSDIDSNGKTYVLFTPVVNRLTLNSGQCGSYVAGFFNGADLNVGSVNGNKAEIFYSSVPGEPAGGASCNPLAASVVRNAAPATFIHELQHMISYNQHVLVRAGSTEDVWLNEGLSHMAEELGGKLYEARYPCPNLPPCPLAGRSSPAQIFPDSAQGFLPPNFGNAYDFFSSRLDYSLTSPTGFGTIEERGVAWLFLRWLADQKGEAKLRELVQTKNVGTENVEAMANESFRAIYADFLAATLLDDHPAATGGQISNRFQFTSRNLRAIYARLNLVQASAYPTPYPLDVADLTAENVLTPSSAAVSREMKPGSLDLFQFTSNTANAGLSFKPPTGTTFQSTLNAQVTVVRLPN